MAVKEKTRIILISKAGNLCSFDGCEQTLVSDPSDVEGPVVLGEVAHIIAQRPDGPRGDSSFSRARVDEYENLIYLCPTHHEQIDKQVETFPVEKLLQMKKDHERWVAERLSRTRRFERMREPEALVPEGVTSTVLPVRQIPAFVYAAPCDLQEKTVKERIVYPNERGVMLPFIVREKTLYTFTDLQEDLNPFSKSINPGAAGRYHATDWWADPDRMRWYITLLNRSLNKLTGRLGLRLDNEHDRYYFEPLSEEEMEQEESPVEIRGSGDREFDEATLRDVVRFRAVNSKTIGGQHRSRQVAYRPAFKDGRYKSYWEHLAVGLRFHYLGKKSWVLSLRPERRFTSDGYEPLTPKGIGRRSTNRKSHMYNPDVHGEVHFWREYLSRRHRKGRSNPRITIDFGGQAIVVENEPVTFEVEWPGVPDDVREIRYVRQDDDLFSLAELDALANDGYEGEEVWASDEDWDT